MAQGQIELALSMAEAEGNGHAGVNTMSGFLEPKGPGANSATQLLQQSPQIVGVGERKLNLPARTSQFHPGHHT